MKRVQEKVKDIVEVCPFLHLHDFDADPIQTMSGYHFTDITADLMAKWIDKVGSVRSGQGTALALAGFRGVGKSHFLAVLGAIVSRPELRSKITDPHVASAADALSRRHNAVALVRRGTGVSLLDELKNALAKVLDVMPSTLSDSIYDLLLKGSEKAGDQPLVLLIDTSIDRRSRVSRDDGFLLGEIAEAAKALGVFVAVALDDDISGADGPNSSISSSFSIDYLDQEHLYKIVETHIFTKHSQMLAALHDIYEYYREVLPGFRWSEPRFTSLYPLHPATVEIAPLIRLYIQDFALLGFASESGVKILGRPANSLIGLDEVFDAVEDRLRSVPDLAEAFAAFDTLERDVVSKTPVHSRLQAKLILKGLLLLSFNGQGSTATEIAASMLIYSETGGASSVLNIGEILDNFVEALPSIVTKNQSDATVAKYFFKLGGKEDADDVIASYAAHVSDDVIWDVLMRQTAEKYSDVEASAEFGTHPTPSSVTWRGAIRRGEIVWTPTSESDQPTNRKEPLDWTVWVDRHDLADRTVDLDWRSATAVWHVAGLTDSEKDSIRRYHALQTSAQLREALSDSAITAMHVHSIAVEKAWHRTFVQDGKLISGDQPVDFSDTARSAHSLAQLFTLTLAPVFEQHYPEHADFAQFLGMKQAANLISEFFSGSGVMNAEAQRLAEVFAYPLGLAVKQGDAFVPASAEVLFENPAVKSAFAEAMTAGEEVVPLEAIASRLRAEPFGLTKETQHMILASVVAQRQFEFVTSSGNRISHRSLDLQIIWDDIVGLAKPLYDQYSPQRLLVWAKLVTGNAAIRSVEKSEDRLVVIDSLTGWLAGWRESKILSSFDALPDEYLNASIWRTASSLRKSFGAVAETVDLLVRGEITLDECLQSIGDLFSDSEKEFETKKADLTVLREYTEGLARRDEIGRYLALCETTRDPGVEGARKTLLGVIDSQKFATLADRAEVESYWQTFRESYSNYYQEKHDLVIDSFAGGNTLAEILRSGTWSVFESVANNPWFDQRYFTKARDLIREIRQLSCRANVKEALAEKPFCICSFSLSRYDRQAALPDELKHVVATGLDAFRTKLREGAAQLIAAADDGAASAVLGALIKRFNGEKEFPDLTSQDIRLLKLAAEKEVERAGTVRNAVTRAAEEIGKVARDDDQTWSPDPVVQDIWVDAEL